MPVVSSNPDRENLQMTVIAEFDAPVERVWEVWADPRKLEKWWGPPTWPATFHQFDFAEGGEAKYYMTGPEGEKAPGYWRFQVIEQGKRIRFDDGFADQEGNPDPNMPAMVMEMTLDAEEGRTRMTTVTKFNSIDDLEQVLEMGMEEGMTSAMGQIDALL